MGTQGSGDGELWNPFGVAVDSTGNVYVADTNNCRIQKFAQKILLTANFSANVTSGTAPFTVQFTDLSNGSPTSWNWSFGDGSLSSLQHPAHTYTTTGSYTVSLNATNAAGSNVSIRVNYITVTGSVAPVADFTANVTSGTVPLAVKFTDTSPGSPTGWAWFFGDENWTPPWTQVNASAGWSIRQGHTSVVMPDGSIVLMGGVDSSGTKNDVWRSTDNGATWMQVTASAGWSTRRSHSSVAMSDGSIVLTGGEVNAWDGGPYKNDTWRSTDNGATWTQVNVSAGWSARSGHSSVAMSDGSIVLMGGRDESNNLKNDVWQSTDNGATWTEVTASAGWTAREDHSSVVIPDGSIVLMGGYEGRSINDVWRSTDNGATWSLVTSSAGWSARYMHSSVVMPDSSIVMEGGDTGSGNFKNDMWRSTDNGVTWTQLTPSAGWSARSGHSSVAMPDGSIVLMGGQDSNGYKNDVWCFVPTGSSAQNPSHTFTKPGIYPVTLQAYNTYGSNSTRKTGYIAVTGSLTPVADFTANVTSGTVPLAIKFTDTSTGSPIGWAWFFGDENWTPPWTQVNASAGWSIRQGHTSVVMPDGSIVLMGGVDSSGTKNDVWRSTDNGATWMQVTASAGWSTRRSHSSVAMSDGSIVLTGGEVNAWDGGPYKNDTWRSTDNGATWTQVNVSAGWSARSGHSSVAMSDGSIVLMGGRDESNNLKNDVWQSTDNGATWTEVTASAGWTAREDHSSVVIPDGSIVLMGGYEGRSINDVWRSTDNGATWSLVTSSAGWSARYMHSSVVMPDSSIVMEGGDTGSGNFKNDMWRSTDNGVTWTQLTPSAGWSARSGHSSVAMPDGSIVLMGGQDSNGYKNDVWCFVPTGSSAQNPSHTFTKPGIYPVTLQAYNTYGSNSTRKTGYVNASEPVPVASFNANKTSGTAPLTVQFTDKSTNNPTSWLWNATNITGNKTPVTFSTVQSPVQVFGIGNFSIALKATNSGGSGVSTQVMFINVSEPVPLANFSADKTSGTAPLTVQFTDKSTNNPTSWLWNATNITGNKTPVTFSTVQSPVQVFGIGNFSIALKATNSGGSGVSTQVMFINVSEPVPLANFSADKTSGTAPLTVQFTDKSTNNPTSWLWNATNITGNKTPVTFSTVQSPVQVFGIGNFSIALKATNSGGSGVSTQVMFINVSEPVPLANFSADKTSGTAPLTVQFTDKSTNNPTSWLWNATNITGNKTPVTFSTVQSPVQVFGIGNFSIALKATNSGGSGVSTQVMFINVSEPVPLANFSADKTSGTAPLTVQFTDKSTNNPTSWLWNATNITGNKTPVTFSTVQSPVQVFGIGNFSIALKATNSGGSGVSTQVMFINVSEPVPLANFSANVTSGLLPRTIKFLDTSTNSPIAWNWSFGDGAYSSLKNPVHTYLKAGNHTVTLTASNAGGANTTVKDRYIVIYPKGDFNHNWQVDIGDVTLVAYMVVGRVPVILPDADFNDNAFVDIGDAAKIAWFKVGKIPAL